MGAATISSLGCEIATKDRPRPVGAESASNNKPEELKKIEEKLGPEVSLTGDQKTIEELRENIPAEKRADNDLLKETLNMMGEVKLPPNRHRDKFNKLLRKIRNDRRKEDRKLRADFSKDERKTREKFMKQLKEDREKFNKRDTDREGRKEFYDEQDEKRKEFYAKQRDARKEFDAEMRAKSSDFKAYLKERQDEFNYEYRIYTKKYNEWKKQQDEARRARTQSTRQRSSHTGNQPQYEQLRTEE